MLWAVIERSSLSSSCSHEARFADEFTLDQLKLSSIKAQRFISYVRISFSVAAIFISLVSIDAHPPIWLTSTLIVPSSLSMGRSPSLSTLYLLNFFAIAFISISTVSLLSSASVRVSCHSFTNDLISPSVSVPFLWRACCLSNIFLISI